MAAEIAQRNPGRNDRLEVGSIDRKFGMRRIVVHAFSLASQPESTIACL
jgi:hypothetical protein